MRDDSTPLGWTIGIPRLPGASCTTTDPELFFPTTVPGAWDAVAICADCPAREACLAYALARGERYGVWGGTTEADRKLVRPKRKSPPPRPLPTHCGKGHPFTAENTRTYTQHGRPCRVCLTCKRVANASYLPQKAAYNRLARAAAKARKQVAA